jgi:hypothetical protein
MVRIAIAAVAGFIAAGCTPDVASPSTATPPVTAANPVPQPAGEPAPASPTPDARQGAVQLSCGGESHRVAFEDTRAVVVNADGSNTELPLLPPDANSAPGVNVYTDGKLTFTKEGGMGGGPTVIKFARGRMAFQDCAIAVN